MNTYLYIRFSDEQQAEGDSYSRQKRLAEDYCDRNGLIIDSIFFDAGKSAFTGKHLEEGGELKRFYDLVKDGTIARGSTLLVENFDRLTRQGMWEGSDKLRELFAYGIVVVTTDNGMRHDGTGGFVDAIIPLLQFELAHKESQKKRERVGSSWKARWKDAAEGKRIKIPLASWLTYDEKDANAYRLKDRDGEQEVAVVRLIFDMAGNGYHNARIVKELNSRGYKTFGKADKWKVGTVYDMLKNKIAIGTYTPKEGEPIPNYFPAVVTEEQFYAAQGAISERRKNKTTNQAARVSAWQKIAKCAFCGSAMHSKEKGHKKQRYLVCSGKEAGMCDAKNIREDASEEVFKALLFMMVNPKDAPTDKRDVQREIRALAGNIDQKQKELSEMAEAFKIKRSATVAGMIGELEEEIESLTAQKEALESEKVQEQATEATRAAFRKWIDLESERGRMQANGLLTRLKIQAHIGISSNAEGVGYLVTEKNEMVCVMAYRDGEVGYLSLGGGEPDEPETYEVNGGPYQVGAAEGRFDTLLGMMECKNPFVRLKLKF